MMRLYEQWYDGDAGNGIDSAYCVIWVHRSINKEEKK